MLVISRRFEWDMGHRLPNHKSLCKNPHGHRYKLLIEITGPVNKAKGDPKQGMIIDFGELDEIVTKDILSRLDHSFLYWEEDKVMGDFAELNQDLKMVKTSYVPSAEEIVKDLAKQINKLLIKEGAKIKLVSATLYETPKSFAKWNSDND